MSIATQIAALQQDKTDIATAITNKGGTVNSGDGFDDFAADIATIPSGTTPSGTINITTNGVYDVSNYASADVSVSGGGGSDWVTSTEFSISLNKSYWKLGNIVDSVGYRIVGEDSNGNIKVIGCLYDANGKVITKSNNHYLSLSYDSCEYVEDDGVYLTFCDADNGGQETLIFIDLSGE